MKSKITKIIAIIIFIVVLLIPVIYSFFYLKSYWDPYGDLKGISIAIVNLDEGENGENQGKEFVKTLKDDGTFKICEVTLTQANEGMQNGDYYATITIPNNFTKCLNSASTTDKQIATITYSPNQASNYLATQIIGSGIKTIETKLQAKIDSKVAEGLAEKLEEVPDSLNKISDGANQILDGSQSLNNGLAKINDGTNKLSTSYKEFDNGIESAYEGSKSINNGLNQVNTGVGTLSNGSEKLDNAISQINAGAEKLSSEGSQGIKSLGNGIKELNTGATKLNAGVSQYADGAKSLAQGTNQYIAQTTNFANGVKQLITALEASGQEVPAELAALETQLKQGADAIVNGSTQLSQGANGIISTSDGIKQGANDVANGVGKLAQSSAGFSQITEGINNLKNALNQVQEGTTSLKGGVTTLSDGTNALKEGSNSLSEGLSKLNNSSSDIQSALNQLSEGTNSAYNGSTDLVNGVQTFKTEIDNGINQTNEKLESLNGIEDFTNNPVEFETESYGTVDSYGVAFTPLFLCIGLWVGALMGYVVLYYDQKQRFGIFGNTSKNKLLQNILYIGIGALEGIITAALLKVGLGFPVEDVALYYLSSVLIGITFMSIIQCLIRNFGDIGKFVALIILVLQLAASGGTFPVETIDQGFQGFTNALPMTYSIKLLREVLVPTQTNFKGQYIAILIAFTAITLAITYTVDIIKIKRNKAKEAEAK